MKKNVFFTLILLIVFCHNSFAQKSHHYSIEWQNNENIYSFKGATYLMDSISLPFYSQNIALSKDDVCKNMSITNIETAECLDESICEQLCSSEINFEWTFGLTKTSSICTFTLYPYFLDDITGECLVITAFDLIVETEKRESISRELPSKSILSEGDWYRFKVLSDGMYCLNYNDLQNCGVNLENLKSDKIRIFAIRGDILPQKNKDAVLDNAPEIPIMVIDGGDGVFNDGDSIVFYHEGPHRWVFDNKDTMHKHQFNRYSDTAHFFLNISSENGKRISTFDNSSYQTNIGYTVTEYTKLDYHRKQLTNLLHSGSTWYGEMFDNNDPIFTIPKSFSVVAPADETHNRSSLIYTVVCSSNATNYVNAIVNETVFTAKTIGKSSSTIVGRETTIANSFRITEPEVSVKIKYSSDDTKGKIYLGSAFLNLRSKLQYSGAQMSFRDPYCISSTDAVKYTITNTSPNIMVWNITDPLNPVLVPTEHSSDTSTIYYKAQALTLPEEFIAFSGNDFKKAIFDRAIPNQDLFSTSKVEYILIVPEGKFIEQAKMYGEFHKEKEGMSYTVVELDQIYNEFTCGRLDLSAIRNLIRYVYLSTNQEYPKNVLLFGTTSFDYKNIIANEANLMPTFESIESLHTSNSFCSDDYYVLMDEDEGENCKGFIDIPIGRIPFNSEIDIEGYFHKVERYYKSKASPHGSWKSKYTGAADDGNDKRDSEDNTYSKHFDSIEIVLNNNNKNFLFNKVYTDAFVHVAGASGQTTPDATDYLVNSFNEGSLIVHYYGHGSKLGWAGENLLTVPSIQRINNLDNMAFVLATTCDYFEYDKLNLYPSAKHLIQSPKGGAIALIATARTSHIGVCQAMTNNMMKMLHDTVIDGTLTTGKLYLNCKQSNELLIKAMPLFGDPAVKMNYPDYKINIDSVNQENAENNIIFKNSELVTISGRIDCNEKFNGLINYELYDQPTKYRTLGHGYNTPMNFYMRDKIINKGTFTVKDNEFSITFRLPKDLIMGDSTLKVQLYSYDTINNITAIGSITNIYHNGGSSDYVDTNAPEITAYINNVHFKDYDVVSKNSTLFVELYDDSGIDFYGNNIGKQVSYILNDDYSSFEILDSYITLEPDNYQRGFITFPMTDLPEGENHITIAAHDIMGNSARKTLYFTISNSVSPKLFDVFSSPNPADNNTNFCISHNILDKDFDVKIEIYDLSGKIRHEINEKISATSSNLTCISWDCKNKNGLAFKPGVYVYTVTINTDKIRKTHYSNKILIK